MIKKGKKLYEGKAKTIYATADKNLVIQYFKDDATAFNNQKKSTIEGKGVLKYGGTKRSVEPDNYRNRRSAY